MSAIKCVDNCVCSGSCTDRPMCSICFSFVTVLSETKFIHCSTRGETLAIKYMPPQLNIISAESVKTVNFIKT
jgi:hypothetical protein